jgi:hypothetical protein
MDFQPVELIGYDFVGCVLASSECYRIRVDVTWTAPKHVSELSPQIIEVLNHYYQRFYRAWVCRSLGKKVWHVLRIGTWREGLVQICRISGQLTREVLEFGISCQLTNS